MKFEFKHIAYITLGIIALYYAYKYLVKGPEIVEGNNNSTGSLWKKIKTQFNPKTVDVAATSGREASVAAAITNQDPLIAAATNTANGTTGRTSGAITTKPYIITENSSELDRQISPHTPVTYQNADIL